MMVLLLVWQGPSIALSALARRREPPGQNGVLTNAMHWLHARCSFVLFDGVVRWRCLMACSRQQPMERKVLAYAVQPRAEMCNPWGAWCLVVFVRPRSGLSSVQAAHSVMWEQSFMAAQHSPILEPETLRVLQHMYNEDVAITNLMIVLVRGERGASPCRVKSCSFFRVVVPGVCLVSVAWAETRGIVLALRCSFAWTLGMMPDALDSYTRVKMCSAVRTDSADIFSNVQNSCFCKVCLRRL